MSRLIFSIGCNRYQHIRELTSAERDAKAIHELMCGRRQYDFDPDLSILQLSPTLSEVNQTLVRLFEAKPTDVCLYFAGHSESRDGRLHLKLADTRDDILPFTSLAFGDLVDRLSQMPSLERLNIILDSCNSSGLTTDLAGILGERYRTTLAKISISILAGAGPMQSALATQEGGYLTQELEKLLKGITTAQRWSPFLELSQIADVVKRSPKVANQNPSFWGMNIRGPNPLAHNPSYDPALGAIALPETFFGSEVRLSTIQVAAIQRFLSRVAADGYSADLIRPVQKELANLPFNQQLSVFLSLSETLKGMDRVEGISPPTNLMMLIQVVIPLCADASAKTILKYHCNSLAGSVRNKLLEMCKKLEEDPLFLLRSNKSTSNFYFFPITISEILGWIGFCLAFDADLTTNDEKKIRLALQLIIRHYGSNFVCIEDVQAPGIQLFYIGAQIRGWDDETEEAISLYYYDVWSTGGRVARDNIPAKDRLDFVLNRSNPAVDMEGILQNPSELIGVVLLCGAMLGLDDAWDPLLENLDRRSINLFVSTKYTEYGNESIEDGRNITLRVGEDFWSLFDLRQFLQSLIDSWTGADDSLSREAAAISLYLGDRVSWPVLFGLTLEKKVPVRVPWVRVSYINPIGDNQVLFEKGSRYTP